jgi:hypothetical protein
VSINEELLSDEKLTIGDFSTNATKEKHGLTKDELVLKWFSERPRGFEWACDELGRWVELGKSSRVDSDEILEIAERFSDSPGTTNDSRTAVREWG